MQSRQLPESLIWRVDDFPYQWLGESLSKYFLKNSLYRWVGESPTPHIIDTESRQLRVSLSWGVDDSVYWC
jgi:hypothetical protein